MALSAAVWFAGCGVPGPPVPPIPKIPQPPTELVARQSGERVVLRWALPSLHTDGTRLRRRPRLEVHRAFFPDPSNWQDRFPEQATLVYVLPESIVELFTRNNIVVFPDVLGPDQLGQHAGETLAYGVKSVTDRGQDAGFSNLVALRVYPIPAPIADLRTRVTERTIELGWTAPTRSTSGTELEAVAGYQVYRSSTGEEGSYVLVGTAPTTRYQDTQFSFGQRYFYRIRTVAQFGADSVESENSVAVEVEPRDIFAPPVLANLVAIGSEGRVDLTWDASPARDLAGYFVYRSTQSGTGYVRLTPEPTAVQTFTDSQVEPTVLYYYVVTAVDQQGNESDFSPEVSAQPLPAEVAPTVP